MYQYHYVAATSCAEDPINYTWIYFYALIIDCACMQVVIH